MVKVRIVPWCNQGKYIVQYKRFISWKDAFLHYNSKETEIEIFDLNQAIEKADELYKALNYKPK